VREGLDIKKVKDILCMRFANVGGYNCIEEHKKTLNDKGYVWLEKLGINQQVKYWIKCWRRIQIIYFLKKPTSSYICTF
jgi:hypothetical protein